MSKARDLADSVSTGGILEDGAVSVSEISDLTVTAEELNNVAGVNSDVQTQLDLKAPLASPTFTGDATFDTDTLAVDSTNNRVGVGTTTPNSRLEVLDDVNDAKLKITATAADRAALLDLTGTIAGYNWISSDTNGTADWRIGGGTASGTLTFATGSSNTEAMRIDSNGRVGIGDTPKASFTGHSILQVGGQAILGANDTLSTTSQTYLSHNLYFDTSGNYQVFNTGSANEGAVYTQFDGIHRWSNSAATTGTPTVQERLRIGQSGELGIGGANYGTAGQVLTSGGSGSAPTWADAGGGGTVEMTASGTLSNGDTVVVNSDGTVSVVSGSGISAAAGTESVFESAYVDQSSSAFDSTNNKVLVVYGDNGNGNYGTMVVGTISGSSISFGSPVVFESAYTQGYNMDVEYDPSNNAFLVAYTRSSGGSIRAFVSRITGTVPSQSGNAELAGNGEDVQLVYDSNSSQIVAVYKSNTDNNMYARAVTVNGSSNWTSYGATNSGINSSYHSAAFDPSTNKVVILLNNNNVDKGYGIVATLSSNTISFGTEVEINNAQTRDTSLTVDTTNDKVVFVYDDGVVSPSKGRIRTGTVSGTTINLDSTITTFEENNCAETSCTFDTTSNKVVVCYRTSGDQVRAFSFDTATFTTSGSVYMNSGASTNGFQTNTICFDSNSNKVFVPFRDGGNSNYGTAQTYQSPYANSNLTATNFIGFSDGSYTNGQTATIHIVGAINEAQTGLVAGKKYYVHVDGTVNVEAENSDFLSPAVEAGVAISSTKLIVKG